ncbi:hypothetical protein K7432_018150 [Basidiobolus ranarum]|uniref:Uncharacterized protein n=1 Tax=Basidiobolus ranarum TaxID=34480 RepID=A0ABR2WCI3_9FUNG
MIHVLSSTSVVPHAYIVEFHKNIDNVQEKLRAGLKKEGIEFHERTTFTDSFYGFSLDVGVDHADYLASFEGVKAIWPIVNSTRKEYFC